MLQSYEDPHCITCKRGWGSEFMAANFSLCFRNDAIRKHRRKILLEREKALLPAMQIFVEYQRNMTKFEADMNTIRATFGDFNRRPGSSEALERAKKTLSYKFYIMRDERSRMKYRLQSLAAEITHLKNTLKATAVQELLTAGTPSADVPALIDSKYEKAAGESIELRSMRVQKFALKKKLSDSEEDFKALESEYVKQRDLLTVATNGFWQNRRLYEGLEAASQRREFIMKCADEGCRGFLSSAYKCGTCEKWTCSQCLVVVGTEKDAAHTCDPNTVETAKAIKAETRPCPKCGTRIFKIDGCDQMWCVMEGCNTAFSWNSGHVVTGTVHNPHYYEWLRRNGGGAPAREVGDIPCGGLPAAYQLISVLRPGYIPRAAGNMLMEVHRNLRELIEMRLRDYPARPAALANKDIDVQYLMNKITETEWQRQLEFSEAKFNRKKEIGQILQTLATAGSDLMNYIVNQSVAMDGPVYAAWLCSTAMEQLEQLRIFGNDSLKALAKRDRMAVPQFEEFWKWKPVRALYKAAKPASEPPPLDMEGATEIIEREAEAAFTPVV
jgi:hypothetical protein